MLKSVRKRRFFGPYFSPFGLISGIPYLSLFSQNAGKYGHFSHSAKLRLIPQFGLYGVYKT